MADPYVDFRDMSKFTQIFKNIMEIELVKTPKKIKLSPKPNVR